MTLRDGFRAHLDSLGLPGGPGLVAVSGGLDSIVLLDLLHHTLAGARELIVAHADHGIHPDSAAVAAKVAALARALGLRCEIGRLGLGADTGETAARQARYAWLSLVREELGATVVFTAHHADDQAETILMRALEGSGPAGLSGMRAVSGALVRPLLPFRRAELARYARERGLEVWMDPANSDPRHLRSWIRCDLLPAIRRRLPRVEERLRRLGAEAARDRVAWDQLLDLLPELELRAERGGISVAASPLAAYDSALSETIIIAVARRSGLALGSARAARIRQLVVSGGSGREIPLGAGWRAELSYGRLSILRGGAAGVGGELPLQGRSGHARWGDWRVTWRPELAPERQERADRTAWFSPDPIVVRSWAAGEKVRPLAGAGRRLVVRCFQDARVPRRTRAAWPVLASADRVIWIPGVCRSDALVPPAGAEALRVDVDHA